MISSFFRPLARVATLTDHKYDRAVDAINDVIDRLRSTGNLSRAAIGVAGDVIKNRDNVPYITTMFEANAEMRNAAEQRANGKPAPL